MCIPCVNNSTAQGYIKQKRQQQLCCLCAHSITTTHLCFIGLLFLQLVLRTLHKQSCWLLVDHTEGVELLKDGLQVTFSTN